MTFFKLLTLAGLAAAATHKIEVGENGRVFEPASSTAAVGDTLEFHFYKGKHSVAQSSFDSPCKAVTPGGFFSGYFPVDNGESKQVFKVVVNSTDPIWFYCTQGRHCQDGMVGVVNPPSNQNVQQFITAAKGFSGDATAPAAVYGGVVANEDHHGGGDDNGGDNGGNGSDDGPHSGSSSTTARPSGSGTTAAGTTPTGTTSGSAGGASATTPAATTSSTAKPAAGNIVAINGGLLAAGFAVAGFVL